MKSHLAIALPFAAGLILTGCFDASVEPAAASGDASARVAAAQVCFANEPLPRTGATASSSESQSLLPAFAIDGNPATRWSSAFGDPQWIQVDMGSHRFVTSVTLKWEKASSYRFELQISGDGSSWKGIKSVNFNQPGPSEMTFYGLNARGRYLRLYSYQRTTEWGVSLFEIIPIGDPDGSCTQPSSVRIDPVHSGRALDVKDWSKDDGAAIIQYDWHGGSNQRWIVTSPANDGKYEIRNLHSGKCLDVSGVSQADGALLHQWTCHYGDNQKFRLEPTGNGYHRLVAVHSGKCVDVQGGSPANGARLVQWPCHHGDNQKFAIRDPMDLRTDPENCGRVGRSCLGGACNEGVCQASIVVGDFQCATSMAADENHFWVGDAGNLYRYNHNGYNRTTIWSNAGAWFGDLRRNGTQLFWSSNSGVNRLDDGQPAPTAISNLNASMLNLTGSTLTGYDHLNMRFISMDRNATDPAAFRTILNTGTEYPMSSAATATHLYYVSGTSDGTHVWQVNRSTGQKTRLNDPSESIFHILAYGNTVYWNYRTAAGVTGIRRLSSQPGSAIEEAVTPVGSNQSVGSPLVDASGIYHSFYDGTNNWYYRTSHTNAADRVLVTNLWFFPYQANNAWLTSNSIFWLSGCSRGGPGQVFRLAKP